MTKRFRYLPLWFKNTIVAGVSLGLLCLSCLPLTNTYITARVTLTTLGSGRVEGMGCDTLLLIGDTLRLTALPDSGMLFVGWRGIGFSSENPLILTVTHDVNLEACFARPPENLVSIHARDSLFTMGSAGSLAQEYEHPVHLVLMKHDFYMGRHEVTQGEYAALVGRIPFTGAGALDVGDSFPVYNVSWYDAVLYCNLLSKQHGYDTVYSYSSRCMQPDCPWVLENLVIHYDRFGYRLPTEAEWEYACRAGSSSDFYWGESPAADADATVYAWYYANSYDRAQHVGTLAPNGLGLFDMAGNLAEWVNDWLEYYPDTTVTDPVGPNDLPYEQYEASGERPVRGGSWRLGTTFLRSSCRKGPYRISAFVTEKDIGFRVALGAFSPKTAVRHVIQGDSFPVTITCGKTDLFDFIGTSHIKLAFTIKQGERRTLAYIDFSEAGIPVHRCGNDTAVFKPSISPDGTFIAYGSRGEGFSSPSLVTVRRLDSAGSNPTRSNGYLPRFWVSPSSPDTFIIYTDGAAPNLNNPKWFTEKTYRRLFRNGTFTGNEAVLWESGSYYGGLSSDGRFLGTSYQRARVVDLKINDTNISYFEQPFNGRLEDLEQCPQICDLSMSPSPAEPGEALLLDFGYPHVSALLGKPYGLHAVIFICNARLMEQSHVSGWFEKPLDYGQWDNPEWSNHSRFIVAVARNDADAEDALYIVNRKDSAYLKVATGRNLYYPALWIDPLQVPEISDPYRWFGAYDIPVQWNGQLVLAWKLRLFWRYRASAECIAVGSSPIYFGFNPAFMSIPTLNIASWGADIVSDITIIEQYVLPHSPKLKVIMLDLMPAFFNRNTIPRLLGLWDCKGYELDMQNDFYRTGIPEQIENRAAAFSQTDWPGLNATGYEVNPQAGSGWGQPIIDKGDFSIDDSIVQYSFSQLDRLADTIAAHGIHLLIVSMPENPAYATTDMIGRLGPSRDTYRKIVARVEQIAHANRFVHFYDANDYGNHDYTDGEAQDCNHLNFKGAAKFSPRADSVVQQILGEQ